MKKIKTLTNKTKPPQPTKFELFLSALKDFPENEFTTSQLWRWVDGKNIQLKRHTFRTYLGKDSVKMGAVIKCGRHNREIIYQKAGDYATVWADPLAMRTDFTKQFLAVAAALEKFSIQYITTEMGKLFDTDFPNIEKKAGSVIAKLNKKNQIKIKLTRPRVYTLQPDFYLNNVCHLIELTETIPALESKIMQNFAKHCKNEPETKEEQKPPAENKAQTKKQKVKSMVDRLMNKVEDRNHLVISQQNTIQSLEAENKKIKNRIELLNAQLNNLQVDNSALVSKLEAMARRKNTGGTFPLSEMVTRH